MIKYFIEHKETHLWWFSEIDFNRPYLIHSFGGKIVGQQGFHRKDGWTNDPNHPLIGYDTAEEAQKKIWFGIMEPENNVFVTEHLFEDETSRMK